MASSSEGERLVKLALCVKEQPGITFPGIRVTLPEEYGESPDAADARARDRHDKAMRRRFERDKQTLRGYGVFFLTDADGGYRIDEEASYAAPVALTESEASLLRLVCDALLQDDGYPLKNGLRMVLAKIGDAIGVPDLLPSMEGGGGARAAERPLAGLGKIRKAITSRKRLHFSYRDAKGNETERDVEPFGCFFLDRNCYVVAVDPAKEGERVFRLDRMRGLRVNAKSPGAPDFEARPFDASRYYGLPFQFGPEEYAARIRFDERNAWRAERLALDQGELESCDDGGAIWSVTVRDTAGLARWCVENGPGIVPVAPEKACAAYLDGIRAALTATCDGSGARGGAQ